MPKSSDVVEVIGDSEEEQPQSPKKNGVEDANDKDKAKSDEASAPEDGDGDDEEYEIEAILDAKHGAFPGVCFLFNALKSLVVYCFTRRQNTIGYFVKWKGYGDEHNSWVNQQDAE